MSEHEPRQPAFQSIEEGHHYLGLGRSKFYELMKSGDIPTVRIGRRRLIPTAALVAYAERLQDPATAA